MARTHRKFPNRLHRIRPEDYDEDFLHKLKDGLVRIPLHASHRSGDGRGKGFFYENVWKRDAKRFWKRFLNKLVRRQNKRFYDAM